MISTITTLLGLSLASTALAVPANRTNPYPATGSGTSQVSLSLTQRLQLADTAADRISLLPSDRDFVFDFRANIEPNGGKGGNLVLANRKTFPALVGTGGGISMGFLGPCGFNTPHVHPRSAELQTPVVGRLMTEHAPENSVLGPDGKRRVITNVVDTFNLQPFYQGAVHTEFNPDCTDAVFLSAFPSEDFGVGSITDEYLALSDDVIAATLGGSIPGADIDMWRASVSINVALGVESCLQKCGIQKRSI